jgi:hypothetical protein
MAYVPSWPTGVPEEWSDDFDELDPPIYESQASYLKRHGLLEKGELKRLNPEDFEPETAVDLLHADDEETMTSTRKTVIGGKADMTRRLDNVR